MKTEKPSKKAVASRDLSKTKKEKKPAENQKTTKKGPVPSRGRPPVHEESWTKATTVLFDTQIHWLDMLAANIRLKTRRSISRAELIRALISATIESGLDLSNAASDDEIKKIILKKLTAQ